MPATSATGSSSSSCARARNAAASRFHVACADADGNVELLMQAGFMRYGEERILFRAPDDRVADAPWTDAAAAKARIRADPGHGLGRPACASTTRRRPTPVARLEGVRLPDWERQGTHWRVPRSSLAPILRFADVEVFVQATDGGGKDGTQLDALVQVGVAKEDQPHYLQGHLSARMRTRHALIEYGLGIIAARTAKGGDHRHDHGVIAPVRTYDAPLDRRLEDCRLRMRSRASRCS